METRPVIFIASSTEGNVPSFAIQKELEKLAGDRVLIKHWTKEFLLSQAYIESLEESVSYCDFGIFVLTADDLLNVRKVKREAPRDNVVFELGLFMGGLGRRRCFIFIEVNSDQEVKLPSDLLGLEKAEFTRPADGAWSDLLTKDCQRVLTQVYREGKMYRLPINVTEYISFRERIIGYWWNRIESREHVSTAFVTIRPHEAYNSIQLEGSSYSDEGKLVARFHSLIANLIPENRKLVYHWEGIHIQEPNLRYSGFGAYTFQDDVSSERLVRGYGLFFDINELKINESQARTTNFKRETEEKIIESMLKGVEKQKIIALKKTLKTW